MSVPSATKYTASAEDTERDVRTLSYHPCTGEEQAQRYEHNRLSALGLAAVFRGNCPLSRELSLALTHLQTALMFANAAIAVNE